MRISLLCVYKQFETAKVELDRALSLLREAPNGKQRQRFEAEWIACGEQIQQRISLEVA